VTSARLGAVADLDVGRLGNRRRLGDPSPRIGIVCTAPSRRSASEHASYRMVRASVISAAGCDRSTSNQA